MIVFSVCKRGNAVRFLKNEGEIVAVVETAGKGDLGDGLSVFDIKDKESVAFL